MKTTKEMIEVMQAYERGERIEAKALNNDIYGWDETKEPFWDWHNLDYRVKPKKKYVPFDTAEEFLAAQRVHGNIANYEGIEKGLIVFVNNTNVVVIFDQITLIYTMLAYTEFFRDYKFSDGTPCGKEVEA